MLALTLTLLILTFPAFALPLPELLTDAILTVVAYSLGILTGSKLACEAPVVTKTFLRKVIAAIITLMWCASIFADIFIPGYTTHVAFYAIMGGVAGYLFKEEGFTINIGNTR